MPENKPQKGAYFTVLMLFFMFVNFGDKAVLGLTAVPMMKELNLTPKEFGLIASNASSLTTTRTYGTASGLIA